MVPGGLIGLCDPRAAAELRGTGEWWSCWVVSGPYDVQLVELAIMRQRMNTARVARLCTVTTQGHPHAVPCCFAISDDTVYSAVDAKAKSTLRLRRLDNLRANAAATLLIDHYEEDWAALWWVRLDGTGRVIETGDERLHALELLANKYEQYRRERPPGPVIAIDVSNWRAWP